MSGETWAAGLAPTDYRDDLVFERERDRIFSGTWLAVCRSEDLPEPGSFVTDDLVGEPVVVVRRPDGTLAAFSNVCRHRSMVMLTGTGTTRAMQCPYHLWTYNLDGRLVGAPLTAGDDRFDRDDHCLPEFAVEEWLGFVLVNTDVAATPFARQVPGLTASLAGIDVEHMVRVGSEVWEQPWNWKLTVENYSESYHHIGVHPDSLQPLFPAADSRPVLGGDEPWMRLEHGTTAEDIDPLLVTAAYPTLLATLVGSDVLVWLHVRPRAAHRSTLEIELFVHPDRLSDADYVQFELDATRLVNTEDEAANASVFAGLASRFAAPATLHPLEGAIAHFHEWYRRRMADDASSGPGQGAAVR